MNLIKSEMIEKKSQKKNFLKEMKSLEDLLKELDKKQKSSKYKYKIR